MFEMYNGKFFSFVYAWVFVFLYFLIFFVFPEFSTNFVFVDGVSWYNFINDIVDGRDSLLDVRSSFLFIFLCFLFFLFLGNYFILFSFFGVSYFFVKLYYFWGVLLFFPFFFVCSLMPSKDVAVLLFTALFFLFAYKYFFISILISILVFFIRDGYGLALIMAVIVYHYRGVSFAFLLLLFLFGFVFDYFLVEISKDYGFFALERTLGFFASTGADYQSYIVRLFANLTNLSTRAVFFSETNKLSLTSVSLFISGVGVLAAFFYSLHVVFLSNKKYLFNSSFSSFFYIVFCFFSSYSPLIQPRYLIPISFFVLFYANKRVVAFCVFLSFFVLIFLRFIYVYMGFDFPLVEDFNYSFYELIL